MDSLFHLTTRFGRKLIMSYKTWVTGIGDLQYRPMRVVYRYDGFVIYVSESPLEDVETEYFVSCHGLSVGPNYSSYSECLEQIQVVKNHPYFNSDYYWLRRSRYSEIPRRSEKRAETQR